MHDFNWTAAEKKIARRIFDTALQRELDATVAKVKELAAKAANPDDIWALEEYISEHRRDIDQKYDYRYSQLIFVFGRLLREKRISDEELVGLASEKIQAIKRIGEF